MASTVTDRLLSGSGVALKAPCRVATTANITLSAEQTIDGVAVVAGDRVLVKDQTSGVNNGVYICRASAWERAPDWDGVDDVVTGTLVFVTAGTANANELYRVTTTGTITPGTTSVALAQAGLTVTIPVAVAEGGTGAATAAAAFAALKQDATESATGVAEIATQAEVNTGSDTGRYITPATLSGRPTFLAHKNGTDQASITSATPVKITFGTEDFDVGGYYDASTSVFTPPAGKYRISARLHFTNANAVDGESVQARLYKNGALHRRDLSGRPGAVPASNSISVLVTANGTDTFEIYGFKSGAGDGTVEGDTFDTWFCAEAI